MINPIRNSSGAFTQKIQLLRRDEKNTESVQDRNSDADNFKTPVINYN
jgi:hypothetical protein